MASRGLNAALLVAVCAVGAGLAWLVAREPEAGPPASTPPASTVHSSAQPAPRTRRAVGSSTPLPRPIRSPAASPAARTSTDNLISNHKKSSDIATDPEPGFEDGPKPTRTLTPENTRELLTSVMQDEVAPEIVTCMEQWHEEFPDANGKVIMAFRLGPAGLEDARIDDYTDLPVGLLSCVSAAVWEGDWPASPDEPLEIHYPMVLEMGGDEPE